MTLMFGALNLPPVLSSDKPWKAPTITPMIPRADNRPRGLAYSTPNKDVPEATRLDLAGGSPLPNTQAGKSPLTTDHFPRLPADRRWSGQN
jgi:hypothetical protein